jgi:hypothetical protein
MAGRFAPTDTKKGFAPRICFALNYKYLYVLTDYGLLCYYTVQCSKPTFRRKLSLHVQS